MNYFAKKEPEKFPFKVEVFQITDLLVNITMHVLQPKIARIGCHCAILWTAEGAGGENYFQRWSCWSPCKLLLQGW
ncbi:hypothetical protein NC652_009750 [Populus alba x Populus x berolinensis]|nr:hypothetical protein NC652_009750 [Populus alba x Populus x berolinensis]